MGYLRWASIFCSAERVNYSDASTSDLGRAEGDVDQVA
jgi:hypothetical protein